MTATSLDKAFFACAREVPDESLLQRRDLDGVRVVIIRQEQVVGGNTYLGDTYARHEFSGRLVCRFEWSPDSKFLVFTTSSSGGHSPWHFKTYVFSVADKTFRNLDDAIGSVTSPEFRFEAPDVLVVTVGNDEQKKQVRVSLPKGISEINPVEYH